MDAKTLNELERRLDTALSKALRRTADTPAWRRFESLLLGGVQGARPLTQNGTSSTSSEAPRDAEPDC